jgi:hypothetical protein
MRISEALALETKYLANNSRTIAVEQQVEKDASPIVRLLKTEAAKREIDLHPDMAEYLRKYMAGKTGLLFRTDEFNIVTTTSQGVLVNGISEMWVP